MGRSDQPFETSQSVKLSSVELVKHIAVSLTDSTHGKKKRKRDKTVAASQPPEALLSEDEDDRFRTHRREYLTKIYLVVINFIAACAYSMPAPVLPHEAQSKLVSATEYGFIFGIYDLMVCLSSPLYSKLLNRLKPRILLRIGLASAGTTSIIFGLLDYVPPGKRFVASAFIVRSLDGLGDAAIMNSVYTICATEFPKNIGATYSHLEISFALGLTIGPFIGGGLYEAGSGLFGLPFFVIGSTKIVALLLLVILTDTGRSVRVYQEKYSELFKEEGIIIGTVCMLLFFLSIGFNAASLQFHLDQFHLNPAVSSLIFTVCGGVDSASAPLFGYLSDKSDDPLKYSILGIVFTIVAYLAIGPAPFFHLTTKLWNVIFAQVLLGLAMSATVICSMSSCLRLAIKKGYPNDVPTYAWVSAIFFVANAFGASLGSTISGYMIDAVGYENACVYLVGVLVIAVIVILLTKCRRICRCNKI